MLRSKTFFKLTRKQKTIKVVREHYLRDDISCGSAFCQIAECKTDSAAAAVLSHTGWIAEDDSAGGVYLIVDTNILLQQIDLLEFEEGLHDVIVPQTALEELKNKDQFIYNRIREVIANRKRRFYVFSNELHRETYVERSEDESPNDRNDRAIRRVASWYQTHITMHGGPRVILLTNDCANRERARAEGIVAMSIFEYIHKLGAKFPDLSNRLVDPSLFSDFADDASAVEPLFAEHLSVSAVADGVKSGRFHQGPLRMSPDNPAEGYVVADSHPVDILVQGTADLNRALSNDIVAVELLPCHLWKVPSAFIVDSGDPTVAADAVESERAAADAAHALFGKAVPTGRVVAIVHRRPRLGVVGALDVTSLPKKEVAVAAVSTVRFVPADPKLPMVALRLRNVSALSTQRLVVAIDGWGRRHALPAGHIVRVLGRLGDVDTETEALLLTSDVPHGDFPKAAMECLPALPWQPDYSELAAGRRVDMRDRIVVSVDPPGCTDIDDALHVRKLESGLVEVGVHIADVSHFVAENTPLDREAQDRSTTVYLVDRRIDMLPKLLGENLCSLVEGKYVVVKV